MTHQDGQMFCTFSSASFDEISSPKKLFPVELIKDKMKNLFKGTSATTTNQLREGQGYCV